MNSLTVIYISLIACSVFFLIVNAVLQIRVKNIAESTHTIVNSQRSKMIRLIGLLARRIATDNPSDADAQREAEEAERDVKELDQVRR